jgi:predicted RecB family nuclease
MRAYRSTTGIDVSISDLQSIHDQLIDNHRQKCIAYLKRKHGENACSNGKALQHGLSNPNLKIFLEYKACANNIISDIDAIEQVWSKVNEKPFYVPISFLPSEKITQHDRLSLSFDALALAGATKQGVEYGRIVHGEKLHSARITVAKIIKDADCIVKKIDLLLANGEVPELTLNRHCLQCPFQGECKQKAIASDDLSLLSNMTNREKFKLRDRGILSLTQLSYTFRPRRNHKRSKNKRQKYYHSLKALAIRESKIYVAGRPDVQNGSVPVYVDVEGIPDRDFYYLIGMRFKGEEGCVQHSFWADNVSDEKEIWTSFVRKLEIMQGIRLFYYGSYETTFLRRMMKRYPEVCKKKQHVINLIDNSINLLSIIYAQIYFPTYSNGLKDIANYLGFHWTESTMSGSLSVLYRYKWEFDRDPRTRQQLIQYNADDCEALDIAHKAIAKLCARYAQESQSCNSDIVDVNSLRDDSSNSHHFVHNEFALPEFKSINDAAYWDYSRTKVYFRSNKRLQKISRTHEHSKPKYLPVNKVIKYRSLRSCPRCESHNIRACSSNAKVIQDLMLTRAGIKRWIVKHEFNSYKCRQCDAVFHKKRHLMQSKYGPELRNYVVYQLIHLRLSQNTVSKILNNLFSYTILPRAIERFKSKTADVYLRTYRKIFRKIIQGHLMHVDETPVSIGNNTGYVWVFTSLEDVVYVYTETREADAFHAALRRVLRASFDDFKGVLVSDFYSVYDSLKCFQQKCLIHLMRDLNEDLFKNPFNRELREIAEQFTLLLQPIIETVDRFGLKKRFLRKHQRCVKEFYEQLVIQEYESDISLRWLKRFVKNREKLFTFLDHDGIPWNNNNAEHAVKAFVCLRRVFGASQTSRTIQGYLVLLSISQTCKFKGIEFLDFLRSGRKDVDDFTNAIKN